MKLVSLLISCYVIVLVYAGCPPPESVIECPLNEHQVGSGCVCDDDYVRALDGTCIFDKIVFD